MIKKIAQFGLAVGLIWFFGTKMAYALQVASVRVAAHADKTRVVFDVKGAKPSYRVEALHHPERLVVRFNRIKQGLKFSRKQLTLSLVKRIRTGWGKGYLVILDLAKPVTYRTFVLPGKAGKHSYRVVVDVYPKQRHLVQRKKTLKKVPDIKVRKPALAERKRRDAQRKAKLKKQLRDLTEGPLKRRELIVAIDAGHGGKDTGAIGVGGLKEKDVTLAMARALKRRIDATPGMRAVLIRDGDFFIPLNRRPEIAKRKGADLFISIHADAFPLDRRVRGGTVFVLNQDGASSAMAELLAQSENRSLFVDTPKGAHVTLGELVSKAKLRASKKLGQYVLKNLAQKVRMHKLSIQSANFAVLRNLDMPSILIETAFISNPKDARNLKSRRFQRLMAQAIVKGVQQYARHYAHKPLWGEQLYVRYKVKRGDNLSKIASRFGVSTYQLKKLNKLRNADLLYVGKRLKIPVSDKLLAKL